MPTFSLRIPSDPEYDAIKDKFDSLKRKLPGSPNQFNAFNTMLDLAEDHLEGVKPESKPASVQDLIEEINCPYLKFEDWDFICFERFEAKKKPDNLGADHQKVMIRCEACKQAKAEQIVQQYQKKLRGQNIQGILQMIKQFQTFAESGVPSTIYFCNRIPGSQVMTGKKNILCTRHNARVPIDPTCIDPKCRHFEEYTIRVEQEFPKQALHLIEGIAEDYKRIEDLSPQEPKEVKADQE